MSRTHLSIAPAVRADQREVHVQAPLEGRVAPTEMNRRRIREGGRGSGIGRSLVIGLSLVVTYYMLVLGSYI
jgi:hypothetical protein